MKLRWSILILVLTFVLPACAPKSHPDKIRVSESAATSGTPGERASVLVGAGDIASCGDLAGAEGTADLLDGISGTIFTAGDNAYPDSKPEQFANCYGPTWVRYKARTRPTPGNHEYGASGASPYFNYFGAAAGEPNKGYYSYDLGTWHIVAINSNCREIGGCNSGSPEELWLRNDLASHPAPCTLAYWHHPLFSSGQHGSDYEMKPIWQALYEAGAEVIINGHDHDYERFAPQDPNGVRDPARGIREFVVGTGGKSLRSFKIPVANSEVRSSDVFGVLKLTLRPKSYDCEFIPVAGKTFRDSGSGVCH